MFPLADDLPHPRFSPAVLLLVGLNLLVFLLELSAGDRAEALILAFATIPAHLTAWTMITSCFLHGSWGHLLGNMWFLHVFGRALENRLGSALFLAFYLCCGFLADCAHVFFNPASEVPALGASGAIAGVLAAYWRLFPRARVTTAMLIFYIRIVNLPAKLWIGLWIFGQTLAVAQGDPSEVAYWAHIGGFAAGLVLLPLFGGRVSE